MLANVLDFSVDLKGEHKIWRKSMIRKFKKSNFEEAYFSDICTNSSLRLPDIFTSLTRHCWVNNNKQWCLEKTIKFLVKFCVRKGS